MVVNHKSPMNVRRIAFLPLGLYLSYYVIYNISINGIKISYINELINAAFLFSLIIFTLLIGISAIFSIENILNKMLGILLITFSMLLFSKFQLSLLGILVILIALFTLLQGIGFVYPPFQE
jgi:hypothetical protein